MDNKEIELLGSKILKDNSDLLSIEKLLPSAEDERFIKPLFKLLMNNSNFDFGSPGLIVHYLEKFPSDIYVSELYNVLDIKPTEHLIWMLNRYINSVDEEEQEKGIGILKSIAKNSNDKNVVEVANDFLQDYD